MSIKSVNPSYEADKVLAELGLDQTLPIDIEKIATKLNMSLKYEPFEDDLSGLLIKEKDRTVIGINSSHSTNRQRFTLAHELGHFILQHEGEVFVDKTFRSQTVMRRDESSSSGRDQDEIQANQFAAALLMPEKLIERQVNSLIKSKPNSSSELIVAQLSKIFKVSEQAIEYRLINLGYLTPAG